MHVGSHSERKGATRAGEVGRLARRQHGVVARAQLVDLGMSPSGVDSWVERERLCIVHRSVYAVGHQPLSRYGRVMAAVLASGTGAVISHRTAAWLWNLMSDNRAVIELTVPNHRRAKRGIVLHTSHVTGADRTLIDGIPVTSLARTLIDIAQRARPHDLRRAIEAAERTGRFDLAAVDEVMTRRPRGTAPLRAALAQLRPTGFTRSELERRFMELVDEAGLPLPSQNVYLDGYEVDAVWEEQRVVVELDGYEFHRTRAAFERDRERDAKLQAEGWRVLRFSWRQVVFEPETVVRALERTLTQSW